MNGHQVDGTVVSALRLCLVVLGLGAFVGQTLYVPVAASQSAQANPELAYLAVPYAVAVVVVLACVQVVLVAVWKVLAMLEQGWLLDPLAVRWMDVVTGAVAVATVVTVGTVVHLVSWVGVGGPFALVVLAAALVGGSTCVLLTVLVRGLLRAATASARVPEIS